MFNFFDITRWVQYYVLHKSFFLGLFISIGLFSPYIFGSDNLAEEIAELFVYEKTGIFIDFTPSSEEKLSKDFQEIVELSNKYGVHH